jgi:hypothetical protein
MNDISRDGLDPDLIRLFDEAPLADTHDEAFIATLLVKLRKAQRARLVGRSIVIAMIIALGALAAPYVAQATLTIMGSVALYPVAGCVCAALLAWRIAHRRFT